FEACVISLRRNPIGHFVAISPLVNHHILAGNDGYIGTMNSFDRDQHVCRLAICGRSFSGRKAPDAGRPHSKNQYRVNCKTVPAHIAFLLDWVEIASFSLTFIDRRESFLHARSKVLSNTWRSSSRARCSRALTVETGSPMKLAVPFVESCCK